jgi:ribose 5-phosphate isomerase B
MKAADISVALGSDHAGVGLKAMLRDALQAAGHPVLDMGTDGPDSVDYPDFADAVAAAVLDGGARFGVLVCGTGIGISIAANRHPACRCALVSEPLSARLAREHNDANVIAMGGRLVGIEMAKACLDAFLATPFGGGRHERRVEKLTHPHFARENA